MITIHSRDETLSEVSIPYLNIALALSNRAKGNKPVDVEQYLEYLEFEVVVEDVNYVTAEIIPEKLEF